MTKLCRILRNAAVAVALVGSPVLAQAASDTTAAPASEQAQAAAEIEANKAEVVDELIARWQGALSLAEEGYTARITERLMKMSGGDLLQVRSATSWEQVQPLVFGDLTTDLVYTPLASCRLLDTRIGTGAFAGPLAVNANMSISVNDALTAQGGSASGCDPGNLGLNDDPPALAIIIHAVPTSGIGNLRAFPGPGSGAPVPAGASLTYTNPTIVSSGVITQSCPPTALCSQELTLRNEGAGTTHIIVDIVGFFHEPNVTPVDNFVVNAAQAVAGNATFDIYSPACPAGYRVTGGGFLSGQYAGPQWAASRPVLGTSSAVVSGANSADRWLCQGLLGASGQTITCFATCARTPGR